MHKCFEIFTQYLFEAAVALLRSTECTGTTVFKELDGGQPWDKVKSIGRKESGPRRERGPGHSWGRWPECLVEGPHWTLASQVLLQCGVLRLSAPRDHRPLSPLWIKEEAE